MLFLTRLQQQSQQLAHKVALEMAGPHPAGCVTYGALEQMVQRTMAYLLALGTRPGDRVALQLPKGLPFIYLHLAIMRLQAISLPLNPAYGAAEMAYFLGDAGARLLFADAAARDWLEPIVPTLPDQLAAASDEVTRIILQIEAGLLQITPITVLGFQISLEQLEANLPVLSTDFLRADMILELVQATTTNLGWIVVILVTTYYLLLDWAKLRTWVFNLAPLEYRTDMRRLYEEVKIVWGRYMRGQLLLMFLIGLMTGIGSAAIGLPGAVVFGLFAGLLDAILTIGPAMVMIAALLVALFAGSSYLDISNFWFMMVVLGLHMGIQGLENVWLRPRIMGQSLRLHPAVIFIGIVGALSLAGILAALIVIPVIGSVGVLARYIYAKILDVDPWGEDEEEREVEAETAVSTP